MSKIWTPEELTPKGWDTDEWMEVNSQNPAKEDNVVLRAKIIKAVYHKDEERISLLVRTPDGNPRLVPLSKSAFTFHGKSHKELSREETDREMLRTTELLNRREGSFLLLKVFKSQA
jgi:hypothetical protein